MANSDQINSLVPTVGPGIGGGSVRAVRATISLATGDLDTNDTHQLMDLPDNFRVMGGYLKATDMDTNGAPTLTFSVGITGTVGLFFSASTVGQAGTTAETLAAAGLDYITTLKQRVILTVANGAATAAAGTLTCVLFGTVESPR